MAPLAAVIATAGPALVPGFGQYILGGNRWNILTGIPPTWMEHAIPEGNVMMLKDRLEDDIRNAMRSKNRDRLEALRFLKSQIQLTEKDQMKELDEAGVVEVVAKQAKDRRESIQMFQQGNRPDLVDKESMVLSVFEEYLPPQMPQEEIIQVIKDAIEEVGAASPQDRGRVMGRIMPQLRGKADGSVVNALVSEILADLEK